jgi:pimeloyl-ACP methyl ester carboxylesterase
MTRSESFRSVDGTELVGDIGGVPGSPSVVLLHGAGQTRHSWNGAMRALLAKGYYVINLDARGHGDSQWAASGDYSFETQAADLNTVIKTLAIKPFLVGASMGGVAAITLLGSDPEVASALVLVDVVPHLRHQGSERIRSFMTRHSQGFDSLDDAAAAVSEYNPLRRNSNNAGLRKNLREDVHGRLHWHWDPRVLSTFEEPAVLEAKLDRAVERIKIPAMLVRGLLSDVVSDEGVAGLRDLVPQLEVVNVSEASHMVAGDKNDIFNESVLSFIERHSRRE